MNCLISATKVTKSSGLVTARIKFRGLIELPGFRSCQILERITTSGNGLNSGVEKLKHIIKSKLEGEVTG